MFDDKKIEEKILQDPFMGYDSVKDAQEDCSYTSQVEALSRLMNRESVFLSGAAGTGKTTVIKRFVDTLNAFYGGSFNIHLTATTGIAASLIGGSTIHSWSGLGVLSRRLNESSDSVLLGNAAAKGRIKYADVLVIDEISMLHAYYLDNLDLVMRKIRDDDTPFGGCQMVFVGDFMQLPPVRPREVDEDLNCGPVTESEVWRKLDPVCLYLDKVRRSADERLTKILHGIENRTDAREIKKLLASRIDAPEDSSKVYTHLYTTNKNVELFNRQKLDENQSPSMFYNSFQKGKKSVSLAKRLNIPPVLELKIDAVVMLTKNLRYGNTFLANGSLGKVVDMSRDEVLVDFNNGHTFPVSYVTEEEFEKTTFVMDDGKRVTTRALTGSVRHIPLKLGYAITVHKSQGQTFDGVKADLSKCFSPGLGYVALSRVRSLDDLILTGASSRMFSVSKSSIEMTKAVKESARRNRENFEKDFDLYEGILHDRFIMSSAWNVEESGETRRWNDLKS